MGLATLEPTVRRALETGLALISASFKLEFASHKRVAMLLAVKFKQ
jgi:hypothetical protein